MAEVAFTRLYLNPITDLTLGIGLRLAAITKTPQTPGETRQYGGRLRDISTGVAAQQWAVTVRCDTPAQVTFLKAYAGLTVCAREPRGDKMYATYRDVTWAEQPSPNAPVTAALTLNEVTVAETAD